MADKKPRVSADATAKPGSIVDISEEIRVDKAVEKRLLLKFDTAVMGCFGLLYLLANLDRNNLVRDTTQMLLTFFQDINFGEFKRSSR